MTTVETPLSPVDQIVLNTAQAKGAVVKAPMLLLPNMPWIRTILNLDELEAKIVDLNAEGIPLPTKGMTKAINISLKAGETKYIRIPIAQGHQGITVRLTVYLTGDVKLELQGAWVGSTPVVNKQNDWVAISGRADSVKGVTIKATATNGGNVYIASIAIWSVDDTNEHDQQVYSTPDQTLDGTSTYKYYFSHLAPKQGEGLLRISTYISGDGINPINVNIYILTEDGMKQVASYSTTSSTPLWYGVYIPFKFNTQNPSIPFLYGYIEVSGYGKIERYISSIKELKVPLLLNGLKTASASNTSTTVTSYTLIDTNGRANRYKQASVSLSSPAGGTAKLYINDQLVADYSGSSGTFNIPDDIDIWEITVELAGNGTVSATANFSGLEIKGAYLVRR